MPDFFFTQDHEWILKEDKLIRVGISDFAQSELGEIAFIELPIAGKEVRQGEAVCTIDSLKSTSEIYAPVSGTIMEVNEKLEKKCSIINTDPLGEGWIFTLKPGKPEEMNSLLTTDEYNRFIEEGESP